MVPTQRPGSHQQLLNTLGQRICDGDLATGTVVSIDELTTEHGVSRSVVREVLRVLGALGMVESTRGVGTRTLPPSAWNVFDPQLIAWRLASRNRLDQLRSLAEIRNALEPEAASLAASRGDAAVVGRLMSVAARMWTAAETEDPETFLDLDVEFHALLLHASGNEMFAHFAPALEEILRGRVRTGLTPAHPDPTAVADHLALASAIQRREPDRSWHLARRIATAALEESRHLDADGAHRADKA